MTDSLFSVSAIAGIAKCKEQLKNNTDSSILIIACERMMHQSALCALDTLNADKHQLELGKQNNDGDTALTTACKNKMMNVIVSILDNYPNDCNINAKNKNNENALIIACRNAMSNHIILKILEISDKSGMGVVGTICRMTPIMYLCAYNKTEIALKFLETPHMCNLSHAHAGRTVAFYAMQHNMTDVVLKLIDYWEECKIYEQTINGSTPLIWACLNDFTKICMLLLKYPEKCRLDETDKLGQTALMLACKLEKHNMANKILKSNTECRPDVQDSFGTTALIYAVRHKLESVVTALLNIPDKCNMGAQTADRRTVLHSACCMGYTRSALKILAHPDKCNMSAQDACGNTALHYVCRSKNIDIASHILQYPDKCGLDLKNNEGDTPLHISVSVRDIKTCNMITTPTNIGMCNLGASRDTGYTVLLLLCSDPSLQQNFRDLALNILNYPDICNIGACTPSGVTALMFACKHQFNDIAVKMLNNPNKCNLNIKHPTFGSAFTIAFENKQTEIVDKIIPHINIIDQIPVPSTYQMIFSKYVDVCVRKQLNDMPNAEEIKKNMETLETYRDTINDDSRERACVICLGDTCHNVVFINCKHVIAICVECTELANNKCPICAKTTNIIYGAFIV